MLGKKLKFFKSAALLKSAIRDNSPLLLPPKYGPDSVTFTYLISFIRTKTTATF